MAASGPLHGKARSMAGPPGNLTKRLDLSRLVRPIHGSKARRLPAIGQTARRSSVTESSTRAISQILRSRRGMANAMPTASTSQEGERRRTMKSTVREAATGELKDLPATGVAHVAGARTTTDGCASSTRPAPGKEPAGDPSGGLPGGVVIRIIGVLIG